MSKSDRRPSPEPDKEQKLRVLVVDDSSVARAVLRSIFESTEGIEVVGLARNGWEAVQMAAQLRPDVITMDVRMPQMDGYEATRKIMAYHPTPILIVTASLAKQDVDFSFRMLEAGALDIFEKPSGANPAALRRRAQRLVDRVRLISRVRVITHLRGRRESPLVRPRPLAPVEVAPAPVPEKAPQHVVVIGASTGGPRALQQILRQFTGEFAAPILIVQHIAQGFAQGLVEWFAAETPLEVALAQDGEGLQAGRVYIAPEGRQLLPTKRTIHLADNPRTNPMPSVDVTMHSTVEHFGPQTIGVLLTGMGDDGARGLMRIRQAGGMTIVQDEPTSTIFGMPRAAIELGAAQRILPLEEIAPAIREAVNVKVRPGT